MSECISEIYVKIQLVRLFSIDRWTFLSMCKFPKCHPIFFFTMAPSMLIITGTTIVIFQYQVSDRDTLRSFSILSLLVSPGMATSFIHTSSQLQLNLVCCEARHYHLVFGNPTIFLPTHFDFFSTLCSHQFLITSTQ